MGSTWILSFINLGFTPRPQGRNDRLAQDERVGHRNFLGVALLVRLALSLTEKPRRGGFLVLHELRTCFQTNFKFNVRLPFFERTSLPLCLLNIRG